MNPNVKLFIKYKAKRFINKDEGGDFLIDENILPVHQMIGTEDEGKSKMEILCELSRLIKIENDSFDSLVNVLEQLETMRADSLADDRAELVSVLSTIEDFNYRRSTRMTSNLAQNAMSTALVVRKQELSNYRGNPSSDYYELDSVDLQDRELMVAGHPVSFKKNLRNGKQRSANSLGSGFFYTTGGRYFVATAAHVIFPSFSANLPLSQIRFVSNFLIREAAFGGLSAHKFDTVISFPKSTVFKPVYNNLIEGVEYKLSSNGEDWAIIEIEPESGLSSDFNNAVFLSNGDNLPASNKQFGTAQNLSVYGLGHGFGLPLKFSPCGQVSVENVMRMNETKELSKTYDCTLDFFSGNSGSPIFDTTSHKLVGMHVRGKRDVYFPDINKAEVLPGIPSTQNDGEVCQKIYFLKDFTPRKKTSGEDLEQKDLLPFVLLEEDGDSSKLQLNICIANSNRTVNFPAYPKKQGDITIIECVLRKKTQEQPFYLKQYKLEKPSDDLAAMSETIEIRIVDSVKQTYHESILSFNPPKHNDQKLYSAIYLPKEYYKTGGTSVGVGLGYINQGQFVVENEETLTVNKLKNGVYLKLNGNGIEELNGPPNGSTNGKTIHLQGDIEDIKKPRRMKGVEL